ncbi:MULTISPECIES: thiamine phosphate synthase [unclassified Bartonella]|uniref:thiamine phosphate synthase n=1 Tax=unclassified Bartonella TaxID=2645622 RepID=UPI000999A7A2|nr:MULTISPECIES: thiamine phosphate synthase [unclassified Bartonella]AQX28456.1 thiamine-phosphate pyrophosphorylase [Bartonella sp. JB15]AQX29720.1 thiamine-phosphate pyrophosphorylase [Bartonella sp. JB63]
MTKQKNKPIVQCLFPQLILTVNVRRTLNPVLFRQILQTQSFVCVILYDLQGKRMGEEYLQKSAQRYVHDIQHNGAALIIAEQSRVVGRIKADGLHVEGDLNIQKSVESLKKEQKIIGCGNLHNRHSAMVVAEAGVDYLLFGKLGADKKPRPHPRNIQLARWWAEIMQTPAIIQTGNEYEFFDEVLETNCEFIAVEEMIFMHDDPLRVLDMIKEKCQNAPLRTER